MSRRSLARAAARVLRAAPCTLRTAHSRLRYIYYYYFIAEHVTCKNRAIRHGCIPTKNNHKNKDRKLIFVHIEKKSKKIILHFFFLKSCCVSRIWHLFQVQQEK